jgi:hypothetical protein
MLRVSWLCPGEVSNLRIMSSPVAEFELTVAGYARLFGRYLDDEVRSVLRDGLGDPSEGDWAAVFAYAHYPDGTVEKVTIFTSEAGYAQRLAGAGGGRIPLPIATVQQRFPKVHPGWVIDNGDEPPAAGRGSADLRKAAGSTAAVPREQAVVSPRRRPRARHRMRRALVLGVLVGHPGA